MSDVALNSLYSYLSSTLTPANQQWLASRLLEGSKLEQHPAPHAASAIKAKHHISGRLLAMKLKPAEPVPADLKMEDIYVER